MHRQQEKIHDMVETSYVALMQYLTVKMQPWQVATSLGIEETLNFQRLIWLPQAEPSTV